jgi:hypothetical protein
MIGFPSEATTCKWQAVAHGYVIVDTQNGYGDRGAAYCVAPTEAVAHQLVTLLNAATDIREVQWIHDLCLGD